MVPGVPVIYDGNDPDAAVVMRENAEKLGCPYYELKREDTEIHKITKDGIRFSLKDKTYGDTVFDIPFIARYQVMNAALAVKTIQVLEDQIPVSLEALKAGMAKTRWQGRMETVLPGVIVDGAHNEDGVEKFVETAEHFQKEFPLTLLFSAVDDKDYTDMIRTICSRIRFRHVIVTQVGGYRKVPVEELAEIFNNFLFIKTKIFFIPLKPSPSLNRLIIRKGKNRPELQHTGKAARRGYDKKIIYIKKEKRREKLWYVNIVELRTRTVLHSARDVERNLEAPVQPEASVCKYCLRRCSTHPVPDIFPLLSALLRCCEQPPHLLPDNPYFR